MIKTTVRNGRIVVDEPTNLPDGHEVELCVVNDDGMSEDERHRLHVTVMTRWRPGRAWFAEACPKLAAIATALDDEPRLRALWAASF